MAAPPAVAGAAPAACGALRGDGAQGGARRPFFAQVRLPAGRGSGSGGRLRGQGEGSRSGAMVRRNASMKAVEMREAGRVLGRNMPKR